MKSISLESAPCLAMREYYSLNVWEPGCTIIYLDWVFNEYRATFDKENWTYVFEHDEEYTWFVLRWS
jgi:hypothetical protein